MKVRSRTRRVAAVLLVAFVLIAIWAAFYIYSEAAGSGNGPSPKVVATYTQTAANNFVASLRPSDLYNNSTHLEGGNITMFVPVTKWINVSMVYILSANRTAAISLQQTFEVRLSTSAWSRVLYASTNTSGAPVTASAGFITNYAINVSAVVDLENAIAQQVGYPSVDYTLSLASTISGSVAAGGVEQLIAFEPRLNFTFSGSLIQPAGLLSQGSGQVVDPGTGSGGGSGPGILGYLTLAVGLVGVGLCGFVASRRPEGEAAIPSVTEMVAPYEEDIASTGAPPSGTQFISTETFPDLVKVADILGKPILKVSVEPGESPEFIVLDGRVAFRFRYPPTRPPAGASAEEPGAATPSGANVPSRSQAAVLERIQTELVRIRALPADSATRGQAESLARRAVELVRADDLWEAASTIDQLSQLLNVASRSTSPTS